MIDAKDMPAFQSIPFGRLDKLATLLTVFT